MTVEELIWKLKQLPPDATCHAYEGERSGIVVRPADDELAELAFFPTTPS